MSFSLRFTEREGMAENLLTRKNSLPPWSSIGELKVINTVALRYSKTKPSFVALSDGKLGGTTRQHTRPFYEGWVCFLFLTK